MESRIHLLTLAFHDELRLSVSSAPVIHEFRACLRAPALSRYICFVILFSKFPYAILASIIHIVKLCMFDVLERNAMDPLHLQTAFKYHFMGHSTRQRMRVRNFIVDVNVNVYRN